MAITLNSTLRTARADAITAEAGSGAKLTIYTAAYAAPLVTCTWSANIAAGGVDGVLTLNAIPAGTAVGAGTAAVARIFKANGSTMVIEGLVVGTSGQNVNITNLTIEVNDTVTVSSGTITEGNA